LKAEGSMFKVQGLRFTDNCLGSG